MNFLKQNKIDATFFIVKDFVDNKDMFYRNKACLIINHLESNENKRNNKIVFDFLKSNKMFTNSIRLSLLNIKHSNKIRLNEIANLIHLDFQEYLQTKKPYMSSDQIHDLVEAGFSIGAHSVDHPYLQEMNESDQLNQIRSSIEFVRNTFDIPYKAFAAPFNDKGLKTSFINMLLEKGYIDMFFGTQGLKNDKIHRSYQRIEMDGSIANIKIKKAFKGMISKSFMLRLIGENQVHR